MSTSLTRHQMFANSVTLLGESEARLIQMSENFNNEPQPKSETEQTLADMMAVSRWHPMRLWGIERVTLTQETLDQVAILSVTHPGIEATLDSRPAPAKISEQSQISIFPNQINNLPC
jgi:hypothetical protein